jgi:hypothetical protein
MAAARLIVISLAAVIAAACWSPTEPDAVAGTPFNVKVGSTVTLDDGLRIRFDAVRADSRCPLDAQCIRAGEAIVAVSLVTSKGGNPDRRELRTDAAGSRITYADHGIELTALAPYPRSTLTIDPGDYVATFVVHAP